MVHLQSGIIVNSDEATIIYLIHWNDQQKNQHKFILQQLNNKSLFVRTDRMRLVQSILTHRLNETVFDEEREAADAKAEKK